MLLLTHLIFEANIGELFHQLSSLLASLKKFLIDRFCAECFKKKKTMIQQNMLIMIREKFI